MSSILLGLRELHILLFKNDWILILNHVSVQFFHSSRIKGFLFNGIFLLIFFSVECCKHRYVYPDSIEMILGQAKGNRCEIEKALNYFMAQNDSMKTKAVFFLVENMADQYSEMIEDSNDPYRKIIEANNLPESQAWEPSLSAFGQAFDSIYRIEKIAPNAKRVKDIEVITGDYLIANIEQAFDMWHLNKSRTKCSFDDFCEYILPYRIGHEPLNNWRMAAHAKFSHILDSLHNPIEVAKTIIKLSGVNYNAGMSKYPYPLTFEEIDQLHWGSCDHQSEYLCLALRALGIASSIDVVPAWANRSSGHVWNVVMNDNGHFEDFGFNENGVNDIRYKISKIYRRTWSKSNPTPKTQTYLDTRLKDVTSEYSMPMTDVQVPEITPFGKMFYLCTFNNRTWTPIAFSDTSIKDQIIFPNVALGLLFGNHQIAGYKNEGKGIVVLVASIEHKHLNTGFDPIILNEKGKQHLLFPDYSHPTRVVLKRKYPLYGHFRIYSERMVGGCFESSQLAGFTTNELVYTITKSPSQALTEVCLPKITKCRFIRYKAPDESWVNASELQYFDKYGNRLSGKLFSSDSLKTSAELAAICDNNIETYYGGESYNAYIGLDFGQIVEVGRIVYAPRSDGNDVLPGNEYELYYWDKRWRSLGKKTAIGFSLVYDGVPSNALLLLHNHTKGIEERIFTYENNEQIWW